jgi:hypothetical protein
MTSWVIDRDSARATTDEDAAMAHRRSLAQGSFEDARRALVDFILAELREWVESRYALSDELVLRLARLAQTASQLTVADLNERRWVALENDGLRFTLRRLGE